MKRLRTTTIVPFVLLASALATFTASCGGARAPLSTTGTPTPSGSTKAVTVDKQSIGFGNVTVGSSISQNVTLSNSGTSDVLLSSISASGVGFSVVPLAGSVTLKPGAQKVFAITFAPPVSSPLTGNVAFQSDASTNPQIPLSGTGIAGVQHEVDLNWGASATTSVKGYRVYRGVQAGGPYQPMTSTLSSLFFTDNTVQPGLQYRYVVTAVDTSGVESGFSNEALATIPIP